MPEPATPQNDGALVVENPAADALFDMGNPFMFATFNGKGDCTRLLLVEGIHLGTWQLRVSLDGQPLRFTRARAIGRLWELEVAVGDISVCLTTAIDNEKPLVVQRCVASNKGASLRQLHLALEFNFDLPVSLARRLKSHVFRALPRLLSREHLWGDGWAKPLLPSAPNRMRVDGSAILVSVDKQSAVWRSAPAPFALGQRGSVAEALFKVDLAPGRTEVLSWAFACHTTQMFDAEACVLEVVEGARRYADWLSEQHEGSPLARSMFVAGLNTALSMYKTFPHGFAGLVAGPEYAYPPRLYFRDGYWTAQILLRFRPDMVRAHVLSLARGVQASGECPSGVFAPHLGLGERNNFAWLPNHFDSPALFALLVWDYVAATGDLDVLFHITPPFNRPHYRRTLWQTTKQALLFLSSRDSDGDGLIEKPYAPNDWADNVRRSVWVTYDQALYAAALEAGARLAQLARDPDAAALFKECAEEALHGLHAKLWLEEKSHFANYLRPGFLEDHFSIDTLIVLFYGLADPARSQAMLSAARQLQTRFNSAQPFGDWGVMSVFPPYRRPEDLFSKSAQPYHYHNGADWPYWDGVYAAVLRRADDLDWQYVALRWWEYSLSQGWLSPVEYYSPAYPPGGFLQGWSAMPAFALLEPTPQREAQVSLLRR